MRLKTAFHASVIVVLAGLSGCASAGYRVQDGSSSPISTQYNAGLENLDRDEVERLASEIQAKMGIGDLKIKGGEVAADPIEAEGPRTCGDVCDLSEGVCKSSKKICDIAERNPSETYFAEKCTWASEACTGAQTNCTNCQ